MKFFELNILLHDCKGMENYVEAGKKMSKDELFIRRAKDDIIEAREKLRKDHLFSEQSKKGLSDDYIIKNLDGENKMLKQEFMVLQSDYEQLFNKYVKLEDDHSQLLQESLANGELIKHLMDLLK